MISVSNNSLFSGLGFKKLLPGIVWFLLVLILVCLPGEDIPDEGWVGIANFDKLVHAGLFGGIVFFFCLPFRKEDITKQQKRHIFTRIMIAVIVWGLTTEMIQRFFIPGRQYDLLDWLADSVGAAIAFFISLKFFAK